MCYHRHIITAAASLAMVILFAETNSVAASHRCGGFDLPKFGGGYGPIQAAPALIPTERFFHCGDQLTREPAGIPAQARPTYIQVYRARGRRWSTPAYWELQGFRGQSGFHGFRFR